MGKCKFKFDLDGHNWECPLEALPGKEYCYWHLPGIKQSPSLEEVEKLKKREIFGINLSIVTIKMSLRNIVFPFARLYRVDFENIGLYKVVFRKSKLDHVGFKEVTMKDVYFIEGSRLYRVEVYNSNLAKSEFKNVQLKLVKFISSTMPESRFKNSILTKTIFEDLTMIKSKFENSNVSYSTFNKVSLNRSTFKNSDLSKAKFINSDLSKINIQNSDLSKVEFQSVKLREATIHRSNLYKTIISSDTYIEDCDLRYSNLYNSYITTPALIDAKIFDHNYMEINEIIADLSRQKRVLSFEALSKIDEELAIEAFNIGGCYILDGIKVIPFDSKNGFLLTETLNSERNSKIIKKLRSILNEHNEVLYRPTSKELREIYRASYEVYSMFYDLYKKTGKLDDALKIHYRRYESRRKMRNLESTSSRIRSILYDGLVMKTFTGYGVKVERPLVISFMVIIIFSILFKFTNGIIKIVNGKPVTPGWIDYIYYSIITFTSLGYSNIEPNLTGHLPQILVSIESFLGIMLMSLFIFTITFRISR